MKPPRKRIAIVTGTRAEFGLLRPVIDAVRARRDLELQLIVAGAHFLPPARTAREVAAAYPIAARVPMQVAGKSGRLADAAATARGIAGFAKAFGKLKPDWVVVLGDRIEAFAAASAASIGGIAVAHIHGGDRAEGIADEAMRHAITKLSHLHLAATKRSGERIVRMGEPKKSVHVVGSPAIDGLKNVKPMTHRAAAAYGDPLVVVALHPAGGTPDEEAAAVGKIGFAMYAVNHPDLTHDGAAVDWSRVLLLDPNADPGREHIVAMWGKLAKLGATRADHIPRSTLVSLLLRIRNRGGALLGNSSAGLIEAAALRVPVANIGPRQAGRERAANVVDFSVGPNTGANAKAFTRLRALVAAGVPATHPYGDGRTGPRIAALLAKTNPHKLGLLRKHNTY